MSHANRGVPWQRTLALANDRYRRAGLAVVFQTQAPIRMIGNPDRTGRFTATFAGDGPPDFVGEIAPSGRGVCFDAKECAGLTWGFAELPRHQARDLEGVHLQGGISFVALLFAAARERPAEAYVVPWHWLGPRWWAWHEGKGEGRAAKGTASLSLEQARAGEAAARMLEPGDWLPTARGIWG